MRGFGIWKIDDGIYDILDEGNSSFYIVEGEDRAAVLDTGISPGQKILPLIPQIHEQTPDSRPYPRAYRPLVPHGRIRNRLYVPSRI